MKTVDSDNENNVHLSSLNDAEEVTDSLIDSKGGHSLIKCNKDLLQTYNVLKSTPMGHKGKFYERVLSKNKTQDSRSQSMPSCLDDKHKCINSNVDNKDYCDIKSKLLSEQDSPPESPVQELWFKTWPERYEKIKTDCPDKLCDNAQNGNICNKVTLNEALQNISLAYSPITKQLHYIEKETQLDCEEVGVVLSDENIGKKLGHRRIEAGSFSSTVSSLSDPSPSGSLLDPEERSSPTGDEIGVKSKKKGFSNFFGRNVFPWKGQNASPGSWKIFKKSSDVQNPAQPQQYENIVASSSALIQHIRPSNLPAKTAEEEQRHREEYMAMVAAAKKKEAQTTAAKQKQQKLQLQQEELLAAAAKHFTHTVLPNWDNMHNTKKTKDLWWQGLPSSVRGRVWRLAIGNELNLTQQLFEICQQRAQNRLNSPEPSHLESELDQESSMDVIQLDIARTFPHLCIFQEGGPYSEVLHSLLAAYVCYRPDVGYVQGMSYIAAILILNMEECDAFICFANLLNRPLHLAAFTLNQPLMQAYYNAYNQIFSSNLPKLYTHFDKSGLTPDLYLLDWVYTIFAKAMPLDIACRIWDLFLRDGDEFLFRTAVGVLHLHQDLLLQMDFLHGAQFLTRLPDDLNADSLFKSIQSVSTAIGKQTFTQIVEQCKQSIVDC